MYYDFLQLSVKQLVIQSSLIYLGHTMCCVLKTKCYVVMSNVYFVSRKSYSGVNPIQFHLKGNNKSKSVSKIVVQCLFQPIIPWNFYKKMKILYLCLYSLPVSPGFKMAVLTPKLDMSMPLHTKFLQTKYFKSSNYLRKT